MNSESNDHPVGDGGSEQERARHEEPIAVFAKQEEHAPADFIAKLRRRIHRRAASSQVVALFWELPGAVLIEMAKLLGELVGAVGGRKET